MSKEEASKDVNELSFKEASAELEGLVSSLEGGELELEEALSSYARGIELVKYLRERLDTAEKQVSELADLSNK